VNIVDLGLVYRYENCAVVQRKERRGSEDDIDGAGLPGWAV